MRLEPLRGPAFREDGEHVDGFARDVVEDTAHRRFQRGEDLAVEAPVMPGRAVFETLVEVVGDVLEGDGSHRGSPVVP
jgi:hypothetical protein